MEIVRAWKDQDYRDTLTGGITGAPRGGYRVRATGARRRKLVWTYGREMQVYFELHFTGEMLHAKSRPLQVGRTEDKPLPRRTGRGFLAERGHVRK